jgi:hypothetical protein
LAHLLKAVPEGLPVTENLLGRRAQRTARAEVVLEKLVVGGDDVLDLGAVFRLLNREGLDQDALAGDRPAAPFNSARRRLAAASRLRIAGVSKRSGRS